MPTITVNLKALETMLFMWSSLRDREKVSDAIMIDLAESNEMRAALEEDFSKDSIRKVLSAISNRELLNKPTKKESRFWNYNMWMLEDAEMTDLMLAPIKTLNVDALAKDLVKDIEVVFYPGHMNQYKVIGDVLYINFFMLKADIYGGEGVTIDDKEILVFIEEKLKEIK